MIATTFRVTCDSCHLAEATVTCIVDLERRNVLTLAFEDELLPLGWKWAAPRKKLLCGECSKKG